MLLNLGCIVEGDGDKAAVPLLLRRIQSELAPELDLRIPQPWRIGRYKLVKDGELEAAIERLARQLAPPRAILVLVDADDDCPAELGPQLLLRAKKARSDVPTGVVLAKCEFEAWFLAAMESLGGCRGLTEGLTAVSNPESIRDAKRVLTRNMTGSRAYSPVADQPALTAVFDMQAARRWSRSFDKCWREVERLFAEALREPIRERPQGE